MVSLVCLNLVALANVYPPAGEPLGVMVSLGLVLLTAVVLAVLPVGKAGGQGDA